RAVINAREKLGWQVLDLHALAFEEGHRFTQLAIAADLQAERHERGVLAQAELLAQRDRIERQAVMLGIRAEEHAAMTFVLDLLRDRETEIVAVEADHHLQVLG